MKEFIVSIISLAEQFSALTTSGEATAEMNGMGISIDRLFPEAYAVRMNEVQVIIGFRLKPYVTFFETDQIDTEQLSLFVSEFEQKLETLTLQAA
ncbi:hypothetical protein [Dyadobacter sp. 3J3]|uniref:hypothetical protein n=1 Tax=Dyadobacter sp. 3J3 TaxID=2606600 RepID=UPI001358B154|nr:hypothetical protein [Dyadobacter sp. 3J3]